MKPTAAEKRVWSLIAAEGCLVCGAEATLHHPTGYADKMGRFTRSHRLVTPLCPTHHLIQHGPRESVEALGHRGFYDAYGIDLLAEAKRLWVKHGEAE